MTQEVLVISTEVANTASVVSGLQAAGAQPELTISADAVRDAEFVVLPGVGAFGAGMASLRANGLVEVLRERIQADRPTLAVCLGLQLLCEASEEDPGVQGLAVIRQTARRFPDSGIRIPHIGWNSVTPSSPGRFLRPGHAYFANSYRITQPPAGWTVATTHHGGEFVSAIERGNVLACQFHPELSGSWGRHLLRRWLGAEGAAGARASDDLIEPGLLPRIIPCLDVRDGRVVKGIRFQGLRDAGDPAERAAAYEEQGGDEVVVLDVSATRENRGARQDTVRQVRAHLSIPLTVGGGIRSVDDAGALLGVGADKVSINTAAVQRPALIGEIARRFGVQCTVLAVDAARTADSTDDDPRWEVVIKGGSERVDRDAIEWIQLGVQLGAGEILLTSWDRDGTRSGYDLDLLRAASEAVSVPIIASGGADTAEHMQEALSAGAEAVLAASIFHDGHTTVQEVKRQLEGLGVAARFAGELRSQE